MVGSRLAATWVGDWFTDEEDYEGYIPATAVGFMGGLAALMIGVAAGAELRRNETCQPRRRLKRSAA